MLQPHEADDLLVARARDGDTAAFARLVERYQDALFNGICRMVGQRADAEDLAQETFVKAFRGMAAFEGRSRFYTWLYSIAVNVVISYRRKVGSRRSGNPVSLHASADAEGRPIDVADRSPGPEVASERREVRPRIEEAIAQLDAGRRALIVMRDIEGFDYETLARLLACPLGTVKSRVHRARLALRELLRDLVE